MDHTSATDDNSNTSRSSSSPQDENPARFLQLFLPALLNRQLEEDALPDTVNDETVEEDSLVSEEGLNSNIPDDQNQQGTSTIFVLETLTRQPSSATSQQHRRQREEPDSNQSNQRRPVDETLTTGDDNNNSSRSSSSQQENLARLRQLLLQGLLNRQMEEDGLPDNVNDGDETVEEDSLVSDEGLSSNIQDDQNQQEPPTIFVLHRVVIVRESDIGDFMTALGERIGMAQRGVSKDIISSQLKTRVHTTSADSTEETTEICTICLDGYGNKDKIATLDCKHEYHEGCITQWLVQNNVCPICKRQGLTVEESKKEEEVTE
ncbi:hypothetical protein MKW92_039188 [Papaver armeniacum]|nr:hypothetical protein MKW92_039188 [Papaver armeniacum]